MKSTLTIDFEKQIDEIDPRMWGSFTEHLGRSIYEGIYQPDHPTADKDGFRQDVIEAVNKLHIPLIRYPGGNFVSAYNWEDGIGPKEKRPKRLDLAWWSLETNQFGIHEFMKWCQKVGAEPDMAVNLGTRGVDAARNLLEYCNFPKGTYWSDLRRQNGAEDPFNIKLWSLGNEMDGDWQIGHKTAHEYGRLAHETAKAMHRIDPDLEFVASGSSYHSMPSFGTWEEEVLNNCYDDINYLSLHQYYDDSDNNLPEFLGRSVDFDRFISDVVSICDAVKARRHSQKTINLSMDEWNVWFNNDAEDDDSTKWTSGRHILENYYTFEDALLVGSLGITLMKHADRVKIGCLAQLINVIAPIMTKTSGEPSVWYQSIFYPFMQLSTFAHGVVLEPKADVATYPTKDFEVPFTDSVAIYNQQNKEIIIFVENKAKESAEFTAPVSNLKLGNLIEATQFCGYEPRRTNEDQAMKIKSLNTFVSDQEIHAKLEPLSWNMIRVAATN